MWSSRHSTWLNAWVPGSAETGVLKKIVVLLRAWRDAAPEIMIGMEGAPGAQGAALPAMPTAAAKTLQQNIRKLILRGQMLAQQRAADSDHGSSYPGAPAPRCLRARSRPPTFR